MAAKCFEQMLIHDMELGKATRFPRWYAAPNPVYYGLYDFHPDYRNLSRLNRPDLYSMEYYRQPFLMHQPLVLPNYESILFGRNNKRFPNGKNPFWRDKRNNAERKFCRQDDVYNFRGERRRNDFRPQFERRFQENWSRDDLHYQVPRDDRNASCFAYRNSDFDLCSENMMLEQQIHNIEHMLGSGNPSSSCLSLSGNLRQAGYGGIEESMQAESQNITYETSDLKWHSPTDKVSESKEYLDPENFNCNESWFCPKEQQQIVDMLKEVNLRHNRQLKRDMLLYRNGQLRNDDISSINESLNTSECLQNSSSDDNEDNINIILYPEGIPPIAEAIEEDAELNLKHLEKTTNGSYAEFKNIFMDSQESKVINEMSKESFQAYEMLEDDHYANTVITDDDKNAVKTVLDFDHMDNLIEKTVDKRIHVASTTSNVSPSQILEDENSSTVTNEQNTIFHEECNFDRKINDIEIISDSDSASVFNNSFTSRGFTETIESDDSTLLISANYEFPKKSFHRRDCQLENPDIFEAIDKNHFCNVDEYAHENPCISASQNSKRYKNSQRKKTRSQNNKEISEKSCDNSFLKENLPKENTEKQCITSICTTKISSTLNNTKACNSFNSNLYENQNKTEFTDEIPIKRNLDPYFSKENFKKEKFCPSKSEPFLSPDINYVGYKRISISEIFCNANTNSKIGYQQTPNHHKEDSNNMSMVGKNLSPTDHLKLILGIRKIHNNNNSDYFETQNDSVSCIASSQSTYKQKLNIQCSENDSKSLQEQDSSVNLCYKPILNSKGKDSKAKEKYFKTRNEVSNFEKSANCKNIDKNKISNKIISNTVSLYAPDNQNHTKNVQDSATKQKRKQKYKKENLKKESYSDKEIPSTMTFTEHSTNHNYYSQSNNIKISEKEVKSNQNITSETVTDPHKSLYEPVQNNKYILNDNPRKKVKKNESNFFHLKYSDLQNSLKDNDVLMDNNGFRISDNGNKINLESSATINYYETDCLNNRHINSSHSDRKKSMKDSELSTNLNSSYLPTNSAKHCEDKTVYCNDNSSNNKNVNSSDRWKSINKNEMFMDCKCTASCFGPDDNIRKPFTGQYSKSVYKECQITNSKYFYQKSDKKSRDTVLDIRKSHQHENHENIVSAHSKLDHEKIQATNSRDSHCETPTHEKGLHTSKIRKKIRRKQNEKLTDKYENQSKTEYQDEVERNDKIDDPEKISDEITAENIFSNSKHITNNLSFRNKAKETYLEEPHTENLNAGFKNNSAYVSDTRISKSDEWAGNTERQNSHKNCEFKNQETAAVSLPNGVILHEKGKLPENNTTENIIRDSFHTTLKSSIKEKTKNGENKERNNEDHLKNILHKKSENFPKYSKNKNYDSLLLGKSLNFPIKETANTSSLRNMHKIKFSKFLKCYFIPPKTNDRKLPLLNSAIPTFKMFNKACSLNQSNKGSIEDFVLTVTPEVMDTYIRNKQALKMNPLFDIQVHTSLVDFLSELEFLRLRPELKRCTELALSRLVEDELLHTLPLLLNLLSLLSEVHMPWNRNNLKKMMELSHSKVEAHKFKNWVCHGKEIVSPARNILKCWDVLSYSITMKKNA